jgi:hypothetical protein
MRRVWTGRILTGRSGAFLLRDRRVRGIIGGVA